MERAAAAIFLRRAPMAAAPLTTGSKPGYGQARQRKVRAGARAASVLPAMKKIQYEGGKEGKSSNRHTAELEIEAEKIMPKGC